MPDQSQDNQNNPPGHQGYLDFELEIGPGQGRLYSLAVLNSPAGEVRASVAFPYDELALERYLNKLEIALLRRRGGRRLALSDEEKLVQEFGQALFDFLLNGEARSRFDVSRSQAAQQNMGLRLKLRIQPPELAALPWEFLYDPRQAEYLCLTAATPIVRYLELPQPVQPLAVQPPLRILGMLASPVDLQKLDVESEKERLQRALKDLQASGQVQLTWLPGSTWRDLQRALRGGPWHIFHFIGHGGYDENADEGLIALENDDRSAHRLGATQLARLLADHRPLRLALLNACEGAHGGNQDIFSSTASILVRRGLPAVLAMQYPITDRAAIELTRSFYEALADGWPVDACVAEARKAISISLPGGLEWGTPVLHLRAPDGVLFRLQPPVQSQTAKTQEPVAKSQPPTANSQQPTVTTDQTIDAVQGGAVIGNLIAGPGSTINIAPSPPGQPPIAKSQELLPAELTLQLAPGIPITFVRVPAGEFYLGSDKQRDSRAYDDELPLHKLSLDEYWIGKHLITNLQYQAYVQAARRDSPAYRPSGVIPKGKEQHPVVSLSWDEAQDFCRWLSSQVKDFRVCLPSEAEWEKAARGGLQIPRLQNGRIAALVDNSNSQRIYPWGDDPPNDKLCNFGMKKGDTTPVGRYSPQGDSPYGCANLAGNVWEWTTSQFKKYPYQKEDGREKLDDSSRRVLRGGSFYNDAWYVRCAFRSRDDPDLRDGVNVVFRVVLSPI